MKMTKKELINLIKGFEYNFNTTKTCLTRDMFNNVNTYCRFKHDGISSIQYKYFGNSINYNKFKREILVNYLYELEQYMNNYYAELRANIK